MKKLVVIAALAVAAVVPAGALAGTFTGVVVAGGGGHLAVASKSGVVHTVRTSAHPSVGARVRVTGTAVRVLGRAKRARIHAIVVRRAGGTTLLAAGRSLIAVRVSGRRLSGVGGPTPATGAVVNANVAIANGQMTQQTLQVVGQAGSTTVQAQVTAVGPGTITVLVNGQSFSIPLPAGIQLPASLVGQFVTLNLNLAQSGATANADDEDQDENENEADDQGGDHGGHHGGDDQGDGGDD